MPNRIIKESICTNDQIDGLSPFEEIFFYRLIVNADDYGRFDARPQILRSRLFPLKPVTHEEIEQALSALEAAGLIGRYRAEGREYLFLPGWHRNQRVRNQRSKYPAPDGWIQPESEAAAEQSAVNCQQSAADCGYNPIQSESQSLSESENESGSTKKERDEIYNDNWRYSPRARSATAQILVNGFHRDRLPCTELRDLFMVVEHALKLGIPPDEITQAANRMRASEFAAHYMSRDT